MIQCNNCADPICDFCQYRSKDDPRIPENEIYWCTKHQKPVDPEEGCDDFHCFNARQPKEGQ